MQNLENMNKITMDMLENESRKTVNELCPNLVGFTLFYNDENRFLDIDFYLKETPKDSNGLKLNEFFNKTDTYNPLYNSLISVTEFICDLYGLEGSDE